MAAFEGAEAARATATGMAAVTVALLGQVKAGDHVVAAQGAVRLMPLRGGGFPAALRRRLDAGRRHRPEAVEERGAAEHQDLLPRDPDQSEPRDHRHRRGGEDRACGGRDAGGRQRVRDAAVPAPARARRRLRRLFGDQAHRRPGPLPRRRGARLGEVHPGQRAQPDPADRAVDLAVQRLGAAQGARDAERARAPADRHGRDRRGRAGRSSEDHAHDLSGTAGPSAGRGRAEADERRLDAGRVRGQGRQGRRVPLPGRAQAGAHLEQSRRREEPDHPSGDHDAPAHRAGRARRARHHRRDGAPVMRARAPDDLCEDLLAALDKV